MNNLMSFGGAANPGKVTLDPFNIASAISAMSHILFISVITNHFPV
jgi:hypothetical protein